MKVKTIAEERILDHAAVSVFKLADGTVIPAVVVGERGRGRKLGVLPVQLTVQSYKTWTEKGVVNVSFGRLGQTRSGKPKLIETETSEDSLLLLVFRSPIGFRGNNKHHLPPGAEVVAEGIIAQGIAGRMGSGSQLIVRMLPDAGDIVVEIGGRRYGQPTRYTYRVENGEVVIRDELDIDASELSPI